MSTGERRSVVIAGGGPVGLALAVELGSRGVDTLVVDPDTELPPGPRAQLVNIRTLEHFRRWGIADRLRDAVLLPDGWPYEIVFCTALCGGRELIRFPAFTGDAAGTDGLSPEGPVRIPQYRTQQVLRDRARGLDSVELRLGSRVVGAEDRSLPAFSAPERSAPERFGAKNGGDAVRVEIEDASGVVTPVEADYLVGCDGGSGVVRSLAGIPYEGEGAFSQQYGVFFRAPGLLDRMDRGPALMYLVANAASPGLFGPVDAETWWFQRGGYASDEDLDGVDPVAVVQAAIGAPVPIEVTGTQPWVMHRLIAERYRAGRLFVCGDAAHLAAPMGGHNMNTGIGDAVDLGWKLAATLAGWGGPGLLDTYEVERRPIGVRNGKTSQRSVHEMVDALLDAISTELPDGPEGDDAAAALGRRMYETTRTEWVSVGIVLDQRYDESPLVVPDGTEAPPWDPSTYEPVARPGHRAPHVVFDDGSVLFDWFGPWFTLLVTEADARAEAEELERAFRAAGVPLVVVERTEPAVRAAYGAGLVLIRPDQHVAWRGTGAPADPEQLVHVVRGAARA